MVGKEVVGRKEGVLGVGAGRGDLRRIGMHGQVRKEGGLLTDS